MRTLLKSIAVAALVLPMAAFAQTTIRNSRHDFSTSSTTTGPKTSATDQLCYFCHIPHNALSTLALWNHAATATTNGWGANNVTTAGTTLPTSISAASQRCMSCHDGTVSIGDTLNVDYVTGWTASGVAGSVSAGGLLQTNSLGYIRAANGTLDTNHPVSVPYGSSSTYNSIASRVTAADYTAAFFNSTCNGVSGCTTGSVNIKIYGTAAANAGIECGSCHDPHQGIDTRKFVRVTTAGSAVCLACHVK
ncbi:MAG TPA: cytochrome c3 family protein [Gemmatimonadales bacterium]|nr:cytochrome c3 family protein [Gemmatimonadales bacterium]